jgi:hypothetical protein
VDCVLRPLDSGGSISRIRVGWLALSRKSLRSGRFARKLRSEGQIEQWRKS